MSGIPEEELDWSVEASTNLVSGYVKELQLIKTRTISRQSRHLEMYLATRAIARPPHVLITPASSQIGQKGPIRVAAIVAVKSIGWYLAQPSRRCQTKRRSDSALEGGYVSNVSERSIQPKMVRSEKDAG